MELPQDPDEVGENIYNEDKGALLVPLVFLIMRAIYIFTRLPFKTSNRGCFIPDISDTQLAIYKREYNLHYHNGYWATGVHGQDVGLHALAWIYNNKRHPAHGKFDFTLYLKILTFIQKHTLHTFVLLEPVLSTR